MEISYFFDAISYTLMSIVRDEVPEAKFRFVQHNNKQRTNASWADINYEFSMYRQIIVSCSSSTTDVICISVRFDRLQLRRVRRQCKCHPSKASVETQTRKLVVTVVDETKWYETDHNKGHHARGPRCWKISRETKLRLTKNERREMFIERERNRSRPTQKATIKRIG